MFLRKKTQVFAHIFKNSVEALSISSRHLFKGRRSMQKFELAHGTTYLYSRLFLYMSLFERATTVLHIY